MLFVPSGRRCPGRRGWKTVQGPQLPPPLEVSLLQKPAKGWLDLPARRELRCDRVDSRPGVRGHEQVQKAQVLWIWNICFSSHRRFPASGRTLGQFWCWSEILGVKDQISFVETPHLMSAPLPWPDRRPGSLKCFNNFSRIPAPGSFSQRRQGGGEILGTRHWA